MENGGYEVESLEVDCKAKRIRATSSTTYNEEHDKVRSSDVSTRWGRIAPETRAELLFNGMFVCESCLAGDGEVTRPEGQATSFSIGLRLLMN